MALIHVLILAALDRSDSLRLQLQTREGYIEGVDRVPYNTEPKQSPSK
jgi:hypothetical protein